MGSAFLASKKSSLRNDAQHLGRINAGRGHRLDEIEQSGRSIMQLPPPVVSSSVSLGRLLFGLGWASRIGAVGRGGAAAARRISSITRRFGDPRHSGPTAEITRSSSSLLVLDFALTD
jgi:hypothetical protein